MTSSGKQHSFARLPNPQAVLRESPFSVKLTDGVSQQYRYLRAMLEKRVTIAFLECCRL